jgi:alkylation response protein AidB-like acyl-CoA dehydrogenase
MSNDAPQDKTNQTIPFSTFLTAFKARLNHLFHTRENIDRLSIQRGIPPFMLRDIMATNPLSVGIPVVYGGRGGAVNECLSMMEAASYESLALSLTLGINIALFLQPFSKYGDERLKATVFSGFLNEQRMGGLMITEPDHGSDALHMQTSYTREGEHYHLDGTKHWAGLTGWADYWLLTARQKTPSGALSRDIDFFLCDVNSPGQQIVVEEKFNNLGLYLIPYGRNRIDVKLPVTHRLQPQTTGVKLMLDLLHHSRMMMPGTGLGFIKRNLDEAIRHTQERKIGGKPLFSFDQVQSRIAGIQAAYTICSAMCVYSSKEAATETDLSLHGFEANIIKTVVSDLMQESAQSLLQLTGAKGYKLDHSAGRGTIDSRPFQIFEGSNDILYYQITESVIKAMKHTKEHSLFSFLKTHPVSSWAADHVKEITLFEPAVKFAQRKQVELGRVIARIFSMGFVMNLGDLGFREELISGAIALLRQEIGAIMASYRLDNTAVVVEDYRENGEWLKYMSL